MAYNREWDKGKGRARDSESSGRKRKHDETEEGYGSRRRTVDAATLKRAPWAADVDWDQCNNVAEMCVVCVRCMLRSVYGAHRGFAGCIRKWMHSSNTSHLHPRKTRFGRLS